MPAVAAPPREALTLSESAAVLEEGRVLTDATGSVRFQPEPGSVFDAQGRVPLVVIRPGIGKGKGRHLYEASMLEENAEVFAGWKHYVDHQSAAAKKAADGLPRSLRDLGGRIVESWWDPTLPADPARGHDRGGVVGLSKPVPWIRELIENDPELIEASISATATGVQPRTIGGQRVWLVEGINPRGSVDFVTEAGAGGRIAPLLEAAYEDAEETERVLLESMSDEEVREYLRESRPLIALGQSANPPKEGHAVPDTPVVTPEALQEALSTPEVLNSILSSPVVEGYINAVTEAKVSDLRESITEEVRSEQAREVLLRDLAAEAERMIRESGLPEGPWQEGLRAKYALVEGKPTPALDVAAVLEEGTENVQKTELEVLRESIEADIAVEREKLGDARPTIVRRPSLPHTPRSTPTGGKFDPRHTPYGQLLEAAHVPASEAYHVIEEGAPAGE